MRFVSCGKAESVSYGVLEAGSVMECSIVGIGALRTPIEGYRA